MAAENQCGVAVLGMEHAYVLVRDDWVKLDRQASRRHLQQMASHSAGYFDQLKTLTSEAPRSSLAGTLVSGEAISTLHEWLDPKQKGV